jgi:hypothetical protein
VVRRRRLCRRPRQAAITAIDALGACEAVLLRESPGAARQGLPEAVQRALADDAARSS